MRFLSLTFIVLYGLIVCYSCTEKGHTKEERYPNGGSELAWLMRDLTEQMEQRRQLLLDNKNPQTVILNVGHLLTAQPTEQGKNQSPQYISMAKDFQEYILKEPKEAALQIEHFNGTVIRCMNCHQQMCPGPTERIKKLTIDRP